MYTVAYIFKRPPAMTIEAFQHHYEHVHGDIAKTLPGLVSYTQMPIRKQSPKIWHVVDDCGYDALSVYTFESEEAAKTAFESKENVALQIDSEVFIDFDDIMCLAVDKRAVKLPEQEG